MFKICIFLPFLVSTQIIVQQLGVVLYHYADVPEGTLTSYIHSLSQPQCRYISEFNIITTNASNQEIIDLQKIGPTLPIPLFFRITNAPQLEIRLKIPQQGSAELYYIGNIRAKQTCEDIGNYLFFAQEHMSAGIIPLVGQFEQTSVITVDNSQKLWERIFQYGQNPNFNHYQIVQNIRLISRHTMLLAQTKIKEIALMANATSPGCQEIFINFVAAHFYPELRSRLHKFSANLSPINFAKTAQIKSQCIRSYISILGYCPLYYQKKKFNRKIWKNPHFDEVVQLKKVALDSEILSESQRRLLNTQIQQNTKQFFLPMELTVIFSLSLITALLMLLVLVLRTKIRELQTLPLKIVHQSAAPEK